MYYQIYSVGGLGMGMQVKGKRIGGKGALGLCYGTNGIDFCFEASILETCSRSIPPLCEYALYTYTNELKRVRHASD
jgi:hypothetical protein